jgi:two-component system, OmpR family, phosphate regulon sensor histidine kinase PhoR
VLLSRQIFFTVPDTFWIIIIIALALIFLLAHFLLKRQYERKLQIILKNVTQLRKTHFLKAEEEDTSDVVLEINQSLREWEEEHNKEFEKLKNMDSYRKEFLGNVSHELKTPIFAVEGYIHTLLDGGIDDPDVNIVYLQKASKSLDRLTSIVNDLESISRMESGEMIIDWRTFDLNDLVRDVIEAHELRAAEKKIMLSTSIPVDKQLYVYADKERIRQVLDNLMVNSIKYGKENGNTDIGVSETESDFIVHVKDNGIGIDERHLNRLFERFYRVDKHRSRNEGGTGLGLAIVKHIIESHQQRINVQSKPGEGTVFSFSLKKST